MPDFGTVFQKLDARHKAERHPEGLKPRTAVSPSNPRATESPLTFWDWLYIDTVLLVGLAAWAFIVWWLLP